MTSHHLSSDHVNYLILRYLQEAGHETAAIAFYRDWHRQPEFRDPENYPFAPVVRRGELVNVIQDGLHHDDLIARVKKNERKFHFTNASSREALERGERDGDRGVLENGAVGSRPSSSGVKRKGRPPAMRPPDEFPTPAPKRQRRSEGSEGVHLNGDAMDVDAASASADPEDDGDAVSPAVVSETEIVEIPERYDSMDVAVQTDVKTGPKTSTMYWKVDRPGATIYHSVFNPDSDPKNAKTLLTVGESLCRFYQVPEATDDVRQIMSIDEPSLPPNSVITASAWHPKGHTAVCAVDTLRELPDGRQISEQKILCHSRDRGTHSDFLFPPLLEPTGIVLHLRYSANGEYLLVVRTNLKRGLVLVYETSADASSHEPIAWRITEHQVFDAAWCGDSKFMICGEHGLLESYHVDQSSITPATGFTEETVPLIGLQTLRTLTTDSERRWDKTAFDASSRVHAVASLESRRLSFGVTSSSGSITEQISFERHTDLPSQLTAFAFRPSVEHAERRPPLLITTFEDGSFSFYPQNVELTAESVTTVGTFHLIEGPALALAWSHDGQYLAVGGTDMVQIWNLDALVQYDPDTHSWKESKNTLHEPVVTWRPDAAAMEPRNGEHDDDRPLCEPSLSWTADGERLGFAVDKQIAVISFRPPLPRKLLGKAASENGHGGVNGHTSP